MDDRTNDIMDGIIVVIVCFVLYRLLFVRDDYGRY